MKREQLRDYFRKQYDLLREQEEEEDPFATDDAAEEEPADEEEPEAEAEEEEEEEEEEEVEVDAEDKQRFQMSIEDEIQALLIDIESDSIKSAVVQQESYSLKQIYLNEAGDIAIDTDKFASEVARLILNFDTFVDLQGMLLAKVRSFLIDKHGEEVADDVENLLSVRHDVEAREKAKEEHDEAEDEVPLAVGAFAGTGA